MDGFVLARPLSWHLVSPYLMASPGQKLLYPSRYYRLCIILRFYYVFWSYASTAANFLKTEPVWCEI